MIKPLIKLENGLVRTISDCGLKVQNVQTGGIYDYADDVPNEKRIKLGLEPYSYVETDIPIEVDIYSPLSADILEKAKAYDIISGGTV